jgi:hypothetical protein
MPIRNNSLQVQYWPFIGDILKIVKCEHDAVDSKNTPSKTSASISASISSPTSASISASISRENKNAFCYLLLDKYKECCDLAFGKRKMPDKECFSEIQILYDTHCVTLLEKDKTLE